MNDISGYYEKFCRLQDFFRPDSINNRLLVYTNRLKKDLRELERELEIKEIRRSKYGKMKQETVSLQNEIDEIEADKKSLKKKKEAVISVENKLEEIEKLKDENISIQQDIESENSKRGIVKNIENLIQNKYPRFLKIKDDYNLLKSIKDTFLKIQGLLNDRNLLLEELAQSRNNNLVRTLLFCVISAFVYGMSFFLIPLGIPDWAVSALTRGPAAAVFVSITAGVALYFVYAGKYNTDDIDESVQKMNNNLHDLLAKANVDIEGTESNELYELILHFFQEYDSYSEQQNELESVTNSIDPDNEAALKKKIKKNNNTIKSLEKECTEICSEYSIDYGQAGEFNSSSEISHLDQMLEKKENEKQKLLVLLKEVNQEVERFSEKDEEDDTVSGEYAKLKEKYDAYQLRVSSVEDVLAIMRECIEKREGLLFNSFSYEGYKVFSELSGGKTTLDSVEKYRKVIEKPLKQVFPKPSLLQIFLLSMKFTLTSYISVNGETLPLILDEPCVYMDKKRIEIVLKYIEIIAQKRQVIILTHDQDTYRRFGKQIEIS